MPTKAQLEAMLAAAEKKVEAAEKRVAAVEKEKVGLETKIKKIENRDEKCSIGHFMNNMPQLAKNKDCIPSITKDQDALDAWDAYIESNDENERPSCHYPMEFEEVAYLKNYLDEFAFKTKDEIGWIYSAFSGEPRLRHHIKLSVNNEQSVQGYLRVIMNDVLCAYGIDGETILEASLFSLRPDLVVTRWGRHILMIGEAKNPSDAVCKNMSAIGQAHSYNLLQRQLGNNAPFTILSTYTRTVVVTLPDLKNEYETRLKGGLENLKKQIIDSQQTAIDAQKETADEKQKLNSDDAEKSDGHDAEKCTNEPPISPAKENMVLRLDNFLIDPSGGDAKLHKRTKRKRPAGSEGVVPSHAKRHKSTSRKSRVYFKAVDSEAVDSKSVDFEADDSNAVDSKAVDSKAFDSEAYKCTVVVSEAFEANKLHKLIALLCAATICSLVEVDPSLVPAEGAKQFRKKEIAMLKEESFDFAKTSENFTPTYSTPPQLAKCEKYYLFCEVGRGQSGRCVLMSSTTGKMFVAKLFLLSPAFNWNADDREEKMKQDFDKKMVMASDEMNRWKKMFPQFDKYYKTLKLNGTPAMTMPFFSPIPMKERESALPKIVKCLKQICNHKKDLDDETGEKLLKENEYYFYKEMRWRHFGCRYYGNEIVIYPMDLGSLKKMSGDQESKSKKIKEAKKQLEERMGSEQQQEAKPAILRAPWTELNILLSLRQGGC